MKQDISVDELCLSYPYDLKHFQSHGFCPRKDLSPLPLALPLDWATDPFKDRNWCFQLHAWRMNAPLLKAYHKTKQPELLREAFSYAQDWWRFHKKQEKTPFSWKDMAMGLRAMQIAFFLQAARQQALPLKESEAVALEQLARRHHQKLSREQSLRLNNHGLFQAHGLKLLSLALGAEEETADRFLQKIIASQFTDCGIHKENSPEYHSMVTGLLKRFSRFGRLPSDIDELQQRAAKALGAMVNGAGHLAQVGDTSLRPHKTAPRNDRLRLHDLSSAGYVMVRAGQTSLFVTGMAQSYTHKHADELSFELVHEGSYVFIDGGKYAYEDDRWRHHLVSAAAHNTVSLRDGDPPLTAVELSGSLLQPPRRRGKMVQIEGEVERQGYFLQKRRILFQPGAQLELNDLLQAREEQTFVSTLLLAPGLLPEITVEGFRIRLPSGTLVEARTDAAVLETAFGQEEPPAGWHSPGYRKVAPTWAVRAMNRGTEVRINWDIRFLEATEREPLER